MTTVQPFKVINWQDATPRESHGQEIRDLFRASLDGGFQSSFDYMSFFTLPPGEMSQAHTHPDREKIYYVVSGSFDVRLGEQSARVKTGDTFFVPATVEHEILNNGTEPAQYLVFINKILT
jgi:quercetin dioxygenase-like cupin family protein